MPELPEVETTRRGIATLLVGAEVARVEVRVARLRWPVPDDLQRLVGRRLQGVARRAKYLLFDYQGVTLLVHLGMSGHLRVVPAGTPAGRHDHCDIWFRDGRGLRLTDPRKFGALLWADPQEDHPLLRHLGPEPLGPEFDGAYLHRISRGRSLAIKALLMDQRLVVGVGNIYANEALFRAGIHPHRPAGRIGLERYRRLAEAVRGVLADAIAAGGTTLRDFADAEARPGYFSQQLAVYGRAGQPCRRCGRRLASRRTGQRATVFCTRCQI